METIGRVELWRSTLRIGVDTAPIQRDIHEVLSAVQQMAPDQDWQR
jgi:hypothetical protein